MKTVTHEQVFEELAIADREEREMELYGPYDPERDEVMKSWRPADQEPVIITGVRRRELASLFRELAALPVNKPEMYTEEERGHTERFRAECEKTARYWDLPPIFGQE